MEDKLDIPEGFRARTGINPAVDYLGPFYFSKRDEGLRTGFRVKPENCNGIGGVYGGVLMAFADYTATALAISGMGEDCTTVSFSSDFVAAGKLGQWIEGRGEVVRRTGSMTFIRGQLYAESEALLTFQAVMRRLRRER